MSVLVYLGTIMPIKKATYSAPVLLTNGHVHTIYAALFRKVLPIVWQRERLELPDGDFLDLDWFRGKHSKLIVLGHGLEGSSTSSYILAAADYFYSRGYDVLAWNHRSCSGEMNRLPRFYHHGATDDIAYIMRETARYNAVYYIGYSLGGNVLLNYLGDEKHQKPKRLKAAVAVSAPIDLASCVAEIHRQRNRIYHDRFLRTLIKKVKKKGLLMPNALDVSRLRDIKTISQFDEYYTAPLHQFSSAADYYQKVSSKQRFQQITTPTLLIQAQDDPMLSPLCFPYSEAKNSKYVNLLAPKHGGHVAFLAGYRKGSWMDDATFTFFEDKN